MRKRKCHICGVMTARAVPIWFQEAIAPGVNAPGSTPKEAYACPSCADLLSDDEEVDDEGEWNDRYDLGELDDDEY